jgi:hypothetical protein
LRGGIINKPIASGRRLIVAALCGVAALLLPGVAQADALRADLDGDGVRDHIELSRSSGELAVRVSATRRWQRLYANDPIVRFVLADVDRDGDPDLVAHTSRFGLQVWINRGRGLFTSRSRHVRTHHLRFAVRRSGPAVRGIPAARGDDSALNDSTRLLIVSSIPDGARFVAVCPAPVAAPAHLTKCTCQRRTPRGPPLLLVS